MLTKAQELAGLTSWIEAHPDKAPAGDLVTAVWNELQTARLTAEGEDTRERNGEREKLPLWRKLLYSSAGASFERALGNLDALRSTSFGSRRKSISTVRYQAS